MTVSGQWFQGDMAEVTKETIAQLSQLSLVTASHFTLLPLCL